MNCDYNYAMLGLNDGDNLFEAAFSSTLLPDPHNNLPPQTQIINTEEAIHVMSLTKSEIEAILAARASDAQIYHHTYSLAPPELNTNNFSGFKEAGAYYNGTDIPISTNFIDFDMPGYGNASPSTLDGFGTFEQPRFEEPAEVFGALTDCTPDVTGQSGQVKKSINQPMKQGINDNVSNKVAFSPIQTGGSVCQPEYPESAVQAWLVGSKCTWPECTSRAVFKTWASFNMHVTNVHTNPLLCLESNCPQKTPFGRLSDLRRHQQSAHTAERKFVCSVISCDARIKEFNRKDHLVKHMRERHDNYFCPINHCPRSTKSSFDKPEDVLEHVTAEHGLYECALKACAQAPLSEFAGRSLLHHLRNHHGMPDITAIFVKDRMISRLSMTVAEIDLGRASCGECKTCKERHYVAKE